MTEASDSSAPWWLVARRGGLQGGAGEEVERLGPYASREEARPVWAAKAWGSVDDADLRWHLVQEKR